LRRITIFFTVIITLTCISTKLFAQREITKSISVYLEGVVSEIPNISDNDDYVVPADSELSAFKNTIKFILEENYSEANTLSQTYGYELFKIIDKSGDTEHYYYALIDKSDKYWGSFIFNAAPNRSKLVIQCPHSSYDSNTGDQGALVFVKTQSFALFLNGIRRCNSTLHSDCDGTTSACGNGYESYRKSDQAHNIDATFQAATEACEETLDSLIYIQLHGFTKSSSDPYVIMSNGTTDLPSGKDYLVDLRNNLEQIDPVLTFKIAHLDNWTRLIATTNTQGRLINNSESPCSAPARTNTGRFIHLEQERSRLRASESKWQIMADAINATFPADITSVENDDELIKSFSLSCYPNPFNAAVNIKVNIDRPSDIKLYVYNLLGQKVASIYSGKLQTGEKTFYFNAEDFSSGVYFVTMITDKNSISQKILLMK